MQGAKTVSLIGCVAAYNDMDLLPGCIKSLGDMDRIIVVDGATAGESEEGPSTDGMVGFLEKVAKEDARVTFVPCEHPWPDLVAKRNQYLIGTAGDWYLVVEPFERAYGVSELKWFLTDARTDVFSLQQFPQPWAEQPVLVQRLFKHLPGIRYEGSPERVVCEEEVLADPGKSVPYVTDQDQVIAPRIVSVMHKRLRAKQQSSV